MEEFKLKNSETGEIEAFMGRILAEKKIHFSRPARKGLCTLYALENPQGVWEKPMYLLAVETTPDEFKITEFHDYYHVQKYLESVLEDEGDPWVIMDLLRLASANDVEFFGIYHRVVEFVKKQKENRRKE